MKILVLYDYPPSPGGLATQGDLLYRGLREIGVDAMPVNFEGSQEKEWYYRWFRPDVVIGIGYWGHTPDLVHHPQSFGLRTVPWLVADGYVANYRHDLESLPLIFFTSQWVSSVYQRDGIENPNARILPVGCDTEAFAPMDRDDPKVRSIRESLGIDDDELMLLTVGGDAASKGAREVMEALAALGASIPRWKYVCKVWPQSRTTQQNQDDLQLARQLGIADRVHFVTDRASRNYMPYLLNACDLYAAPSRLEGFGMLQIEANACGKPVISISAMAPQETLVHDETALLASVASEILLHEAIVGPESGYPEQHRLVFERPRVADYRASIPHLAEQLSRLMNDPDLRERLGTAGRIRVTKLYDHRRVARRCITFLREAFELTAPDELPFETIDFAESAA